MFRRFVLSKNIPSIFFCENCRVKINYWIFFEWKFWIHPSYETSIWIFSTRNCCTSDAKNCIFTLGQKSIQLPKKNFEMSFFKQKSQYFWRTSDAKNCIFWLHYFWAWKINIAAICYSWMQNKKNLSSDRYSSHFVSLLKPAKMWQIEMFIFRPLSQLAWW